MIGGILKRISARTQKRAINIRELRRRGWKFFTPARCRHEQFSLVGERISGERGRTPMPIRSYRCRTCNRLFDAKRSLRGRKLKPDNTDLPLTEKIVPVGEDKPVNGQEGIPSTIKSALQFLTHNRPSYDRWLNYEVEIIHQQKARKQASLLEQANLLLQSNMHTPYGPKIADEHKIRSPEWKAFLELVKTNTIVEYYPQKDNTYTPGLSLYSDFVCIPCIQDILRLYASRRKHIYAAMLAACEKQEETSIDLLEHYCKTFIPIWVENRLSPKDIIVYLEDYFENLLAQTYELSGKHSKFQLIIESHVLSQSILKEINQLLSGMKLETFRQYLYRWGYRKKSIL